VTIRIYALALLTLFIATSDGLFGQRQRFSWQDACFKNPALPYCPGHEFAVKKTKPGKNGAPATTVYVEDSVAGGIDWRFADPHADWIAGLNFSELPPSTLARKLIGRLGAAQGLSEAELQKTLDVLSGAQRVAFSVRDKAWLIVVSRKTPYTMLPTAESGWKIAPLGENALLLGHSEAVDEAMQRMADEEPAADLTRLAVQRQGNSDFWVVGSGKLLGGGVESLGLKWFSVVASVQERLSTDELFEFNAPPDPNAFRRLPLFAKATLEGNLLHVRTYVEPSDLQQRFADIAGSLVGERLAAVVNIAQHVPASHAPATEKSKPVIYGLDSGPTELR